MWNDIFADIDEWIDSSKQHTQCIIITGEVSAGKTRVLKELLDDRNVPKSLRPTSSIEPQTSIPLVIRQHDVWQLSLHNPSGQVRALTEFPSRKSLSVEDAQSGNFICLEGPFWTDGDCAVEILDLRGWNEKKSWEEEIQYLEEVLESKLVIGILNVVSYRHITSGKSARDNLSKALSFLSHQQRLIDEATVIPIVTKIKEGENGSNINYTYITNEIIQFMEEIEDNIESGIVFFDKSIDDENPVYRFMIDLEDCDETEREDFRYSLWDELDVIVSHIPDVQNIDAEIIEKDLHTIQSILSSLQKLKPLVQHQLEMPVNAAKVTGLSNKEIKDRLMNTMMKEFARHISQKDLRSLLDSYQQNQIAPTSPLHKWYTHFIQPSLKLIADESNKWTVANDKALDVVVNNIRKLNSIKKSTEMFRNHQRSTDKLLHEIAHLETYKKTLKTTDVESILEHIEQLFVESILHQELNP